MPWLDVINLKSIMVQKAINKQFAIPSLTSFNTRNHPSEEKYKFQVDFICAINDHIKARVARGESEQKLTVEMQSLVKEFYTGLRESGTNETVKHWLMCGSKMVWSGLSRSDYWFCVSKVHLSQEK